MSQLYRQAKVLHLIQGLDTGGLERMVVALLNGLDRRSYLPSVCCFDCLGEQAGVLSPDTKVTLLKRQPGVDAFYPLKLARLIRHERVDVLHLHNSTAFFYGVLAGKLARVPVIVFTEHDREFPSKVQIRLVNRLLVRGTSRVVTVAVYLRDLLRRYEKFSTNKMTVIYNGVPDVDFRQREQIGKLRRCFGIRDSSRIVAIVARLDPIKNHQCLLHSMRTVMNRIPQAVLLIVGDGPLRGPLEDLARRLDLLGHVRFLGTRSDIPEILALADVFVLCSHSEGLSLTLLEAQAAGKPIVATRVGGNAEVVDDGVNGVLVPPDDPTRLAEALISLLADRKLARRMGREGRKRFEAEFRLEAMVQKYEKLYADCLGTVSESRLRTS